MSRGAVPEAAAPDPSAAWLQAGLAARFARIAALHPSRQAVFDAERALTYAELADLARRIAGVLPMRGAEPLPIGIFLDHEARYPAAMLAIWTAGHIAVPLDPAHPEARIAEIAALVGLAAVVSAGRLVERAAALPGVGMRPVDLEGLSGDRLAADWPVGPAEIAHILCTSGSTGKPKGVMVSHQAVLHDAMQYVTEAGIGPGDRLTQLYSAATSGAVRDIWAALLSGATLCVHPPQRGAAALAVFLRQQNPTIYHSVPVLLRHLAMEARDGAGTHFPTVRLCYLAGDRVDAEDVLAAERLFPEARIYTGLGATECSTLYVHRFVPRGSVAPGRKVPVGGPVADREVLLLDADGSPVPPGEIGEIVVASRYIATGYWRDPAQTAQRFLPDPRLGWRRFSTGDLGCWRPDGLLEHRGRADQMVKINGARVELPAIEAVLKGEAGVHEAVALVRTGPGGHPVLVAHWQAEDPEQPPSVPSLQRALAAILPASHVPAVMVRSTALPLLPNFKPDRAALRRQDEALALRAGEEPPNATVAAIQAELMAMLDLPFPPDIDLELPALGLDSIAIVDLEVRLARRFGREVPIDVLVAGATPRRIGAWIDAILGDLPTTYRCVVPIRRAAGDKPPIVWLPALGGHFEDGKKLCGLMPADRDWFGLRDPARLQLSAIPDTVESLVALMRAAWEVADGRPFIPAGFSFGGRQAWALGAEMLRVGLPVPAVLILDAEPFPRYNADQADTLLRETPDQRANVYRWQAAWRYQPSPAPLDVLLVRAQGHRSGQPDHLGWPEVARSVRTARVPGGHFDMYTEAGLAGLAVAIERLLAEL